MEETQESKINSIILEGINTIAINVEQSDLNQCKPPFLASNFSRWRRRAIEKLHEELKNSDFETKQKYYSDFSFKINGDLFDDFTRLMKQPYFDIIFFENYGVPKEVNTKTAKSQYGLIKDIEDLSQAIADWCIQIEISSDLVERAEELGYFSWKKSEKEIYKDLKKQLEGENTYTIPQQMKKFIKSQIVNGMKSVSGIIFSKGLALSNVSFGVLYVVYMTMIGSSSFPIQMLLPRFHLAYLAGGFLGSYAINKVADNIQANEIKQNINNLAEIFRGITLNLVEFNDQCQYRFKRCLNSKTVEGLQKETEELSQVFKQLFTDSNKFKDIRDQALKIRDLSEQQDENDWTLLSPGNKQIEMINFGSYVEQQNEYQKEEEKIDN